MARASQIAQKKKDARKETVIETYRSTASITRACEAAKVSRRTHYDWLEADEEYAAAIEKAAPQANKVLEDEATRRAIEGTLKPVYYLGRKVGDIREYSDTLLIFLLKGAQPDKYRDNFKIDTTAKVTTETSEAQSLASALTPDELATIRARLAQSADQPGDN